MPSNNQDTDLAEMQEFALNAFKTYAKTAHARLVAIDTYSRVVIARTELKKLERLGLPLPACAKTVEPGQ